MKWKMTWSVYEDLTVRSIKRGYADPYDVWLTPLTIRVRQAFYKRLLIGKMCAAGIACFDWFAPGLLRLMINAPRRVHPITAGLLAQIDVLNGYRWLRPEEWCQLFRSLASCKGSDEQWAWGLGFVWMSKNGLYGTNVPFITHTPYIMEALLEVARQDGAHAEECYEMFRGTWRFLESLKVMDETVDTLSLSYAPMNEIRPVVNANSYASFAFALHAVNNENKHNVALDKALRIARWVVNQQRSDGSWTYFADDLPGNFIDGFHSCLVLRNLIKVAKIVPSASGIVETAIDKGWAFLRVRAFDKQNGMLRRFVIRDFLDPYAWDIYDQAEYLGLLIDFGEIEEAVRFRSNIKNHFSNGRDWWCRIDILGRRWGKNFLRWGIVPFWFHSARLDCALERAV
jgi:hypothetical protein